MNGPINLRFWNSLLSARAVIPKLKNYFLTVRNAAFSLTERIPLCTLLNKRTDTNSVRLCVSFHNTTNCHFVFYFHFIKRVSRWHSVVLILTECMKTEHRFCKAPHGPSLTQMISLEILSSIFSDRRDCWLVRYDAVQFDIVCQRRTTLTRLPGITYLNTLNVGRINTTFLHPIYLVTIYPPVCVSR